MRFIYLLFLIFLSIISKELLGQEYSYTRYDIKEGLAGSVVYCMTQDKDGFLWFGTESGLSRFDGTRFTNFTSLDGLPDNEILNVFADSKGRVWIAPFRASVCYYYKGHIYTQENDPLLKNIKLSSFVLNFCEDSEGNVLLVDKASLYLIQKDGVVKQVQSVDGTNRPHEFAQIGPREGGGFWVNENSKFYEWVNDKFILNNSFVLNYVNYFITPHPNFIAISKNMLVVKDYPLHTAFIDLKTGIKHKIPYRPSHKQYVILNDSLFAYCTREGAYITNKNGSGSTKEYLKNISINNAMYDSEKNLWFCTDGNGIYKLNSEAIRNMSLKEPATGNVGVFSIVQHGQSILLGSAQEKIYILDFPDGKLKISHFRSPDLWQAFSPIVDINTKTPGFILFGTGIGIFKYTSDYKFYDTISYVALKKFHSWKERKMLVATSRHVLVLDPINFKVLDTIWNQRATCVYAQKDTIYIGGLNGVYRILPNRVIEFLGDKLPLLRNRITSISEANDGTLWMSTYGNGVIAYKNQQVTANLTAPKLTSNICKTLFLKDNRLWIGTDKGVNKVIITDSNYPVTKYTTADGLASDNIYAVFQNDSMVFIGTSAGLTYFNEKYIASESLCDLKMTNLRVSNEELTPDSTGFVLTHSKNNIRFDYVGISFRSVGDIVYKYQLLGLDTGWQYTRETFLSYPTLPSGVYELQIQATNKFNVKSQVLKVKFTISELLWEKTWFRILLSIVLLAFIGLMLRILNSRVRKREAEKTRISSRISELEQLALKSQMNPHFIFNSLNSIQQYVMDKDIAGANRFISGFSKLIRQTLDFSSKPLVNLSDEIGYLRTYLELEKNRLEDKFTFEVSVSEELKDSDYQVPPMILQPYLENSLRHGIRFRKDNEGRISIRVTKMENRLICVIEDNGVGRKLAAQYKSINPIEYQSKGMSLTADRLELINQNIKNKIEVRIDDIEFENGTPAGTRVTVSFPTEFV